MKSYLLVLLVFCGFSSCLCAQPVLPKAANLEESLKTARVGGKYAMLLAQIEVPGDRAKYGDFNDLGFSNAPERAGFKDLPTGYCVYVAPYWYIWRDVLQSRRSWGPEQVIGEPDTPELGDKQTAWASRSQDNQEEWLIAEFAAPVSAVAVKVYETYHPGAISKITAFALDGKETEIWAGQAALNPAAGIVVNHKEFPRALKTNRVKIYLDSPSVEGWNEIDAIGLLDKDGRTQWASAVACSSTFAEQNGRVVHTGFIPALPDAARVQQLEEQMLQMQNDINELRQRAGLPPRPVIIAPPNLDLFFGDGEGAVILQDNLVVPGFAPAPVPPPRR